MTDIIARREFAPLYIRRLQPVLGTVMDVNELWVYQFCLDMAVDIEG